MKHTLALFGALLVLGLAVFLAWRPSSRQVRPNIVFVLIDTLRADHLGCYGYERPTSPNIDRIAQQGIQFKHVFSVSDWTNPTIVSCFTGHYPQAVLPPALHDDAIRRALPGELPTLAELLQQQGYRTAGLVDHPGITRRLGFARGFDDYTMLYAEGPGGGIWQSTDAAYVLGEFESTVDAMGEQPFFIYLHLVYPHQPYEAPAPYAGMFGPAHTEVVRAQGQAVVNSYDAEIRFTDALVGEVFSSLADRELLDSTYFVVTSDHGESFWEHGHKAHGKTFYNEVMRVPLIVYPPGGRKSEPALVATPVSNIDLFPTLAALGGAELPEGIDGESLTRFFGSQGRSSPGPLFSESPNRYDIAGRAVIDGSLKYILTPSEIGKEGERAYQLYNWLADPDERKNLANEQPEALKKLQLLLEDHRQDVELRRSMIKELTSEPQSETVERLRALGYAGD